MFEYIIPRWHNNYKLHDLRRYIMLNFNLFVYNKSFAKFILSTVASKLFAPIFFEKCLKSQIIKMQLSCQFTTGMFVRNFT